VLERLFREARTYREKANVVDYTADRVAFVRDGLLGLTERVSPGVDVRRAIRAARALREAVAWLGVDCLIVPAWRLVDACGRRLSRASAPVTRALVMRFARHLGRPSSVPPRDRDVGIER